MSAWSCRYEPPKEIDPDEEEEAWDALEEAQHEYEQACRVQLAKLKKIESEVKSVCVNPYSCIHLQNAPSRHSGRRFLKFSKQINVA